MQSLLMDYWPELLPCALGLAAIYLLLPRARRFPPIYDHVMLGGLTFWQRSDQLHETVEHVHTVFRRSASSHSQGDLVPISQG